MLLTRSPLGLHRCCHRMDLVRLACVKHAASVRPEPGSNSPSRSEPRSRPRRRSGEPALRSARGGLRRRLAQHGLLSVTVQITRYNPTRSRTRRVARTGFWLSLFRFQGATDTHPEALVPSRAGSDRRSGSVLCYGYGRAVSKGIPTSFARGPHQEINPGQAPEILRFAREPGRLAGGRTGSPA